MNRKFRFHVVDMPYTISDGSMPINPFSEKMIKFCKFMKNRGHQIFHYGHKDSEVDCDVSVNIFDRNDWETFWPEKKWEDKHNGFIDYCNQYADNYMYKKASDAIKEYKNPNDIFLNFIGNSQKIISDENPDLITVEPSIGYSKNCSYANWRVYESYSSLHALTGEKSLEVDPYGDGYYNWYHAVIPGFFDHSKYEYSENKQDYFLYFGRVIRLKGVAYAIEATKTAGKKLIIAGPGDIVQDSHFPYEKIPDHVTCIGAVGHNERTELMKNAKCCFMMTTSAETFCNTMAESFLHGTPIISTDWGSFSENNLHGITGYRVRTLDHMVWAIQNIDKIKPINCRNWGETFSFENAAIRYEEYFNMIMDYYEKGGWNTLRPDRDNLDWLNYRSPFK
jgi:glycosyltransferase involved in cell wall biosynthesis